MTKKAVLRFMQGHARAGRLILGQRRSRLMGLSVHESLKQYGELCSMFYGHRARGDFSALDRRALAFHLRQRKIFDSLARHA